MNRDRPRYRLASGTPILGLRDYVEMSRSPLGCIIQAQIADDGSYVVIDDYHPHGKIVTLPQHRQLAFERVGNTTLARVV